VSCAVSANRSPASWSSDNARIHQDGKLHRHEHLAIRVASRRDCAAILRLHPVERPIPNEFP
jgi:hypothetical protein